MGLFVNIESIDRGGKTTQAPLVFARLRAAGVRVAVMNFPDTPKRNPTPTSAHFATGVLIERFLDGDLPLVDLNDTLFKREFRAYDEEEDLEEIFRLGDFPKGVREEIAAIVQEKLVQVLFSVNRRERREALQDLLEANDVVLVGRYLSAQAYGVARGVSKAQLASLEGDLHSPDLTFLIDIDPAVARLRRSDAVEDVYEADRDLQSKVHRLYNDMVVDDARAAEAEGRPARFVRLEGAAPMEAITDQIVGGILERLGLSEATTAPEAAEPASTGA